MKRIISILLALLMILSLVACASTEKSDAAASTEEAAATPADASSTEKITINIGVGSFATSSVYAAKEQFEAANPNVSINVIEIPFGSLYEKLCTAFANIA